MKSKVLVVAAMVAAMFLAACAPPLFKETDGSEFAKLYEGLCRFPYGDSQALRNDMRCLAAVMAGRMSGKTLSLEVVTKDLARVTVSVKGDSTALKNMVLGLFPRERKGWTPVVSIPVGSDQSLYSSCREREIELMGYFRYAMTGYDFGPYSAEGELEDLGLEDYESESGIPEEDYGEGLSDEGDEADISDLFGDS